MQHEWVRITEADPEHSARYAERFRTMEAEGRDLHGEARFIDAMVGRGAHVLDAGCGPGRVGGELAARGHRVVGVDIDPVLIAVAEADHPDPLWICGDLTELDLTGHGVAEPFDAIVCAGNVMTFVAPEARVEILRRFGLHLAPDGRAVVGFGAGRGYEFDEFLDDATSAGLAPDLLLSTWDLRPFPGPSDFLVAVLVRVDAATEETTGR